MDDISCEELICRIFADIPLSEIIRLRRESQSMRQVLHENRELWREKVLEDVILLRHYDDILPEDRTWYWVALMIDKNSMIFYSNSQLYIGELSILGVPCGDGIYITESMYCVGRFNGSKMEGTKICSNSIERGHFIDFNLNGLGSRETKYSLSEGCWMEGMRNGYIREINKKNNSIFEGNYNLDLRDGYGTEITREYTYAGNYYKNVRRGFGIFTWMNNGLIFIGDINSYPYRGISICNGIIDRV